MCYHRREEVALNTLPGKVGLYVPIDLGDSIKKSAESTTEKSWYLRGYATTPDLDLQDDIVDPAGIDISHLVKHGYINYEHQQGEEFIIGVPTDGTYVDPEVGLYVEAKLYKGNPYAQRIWELASNIAKSGINRTLGFSIEGFCHQRDENDPRIMKSIKITNVAVTTNPANPNATWEAFMKSFLTGYGITPDTQVGGAAIRAESFARSLYNLSWAYKALENPENFEKLWKEVGTYLDSMDRYTPESAVMFLQLFKGYSRNEAVAKIDQLMQSNNKIDQEEGSNNE
ncbi:putative prohead protease [Bacillus phage BSP36]|uniref:Putative prohead protease n=1 Tax=Bacillus phage BSP38 TaxID=2283013 RepID=A0A345MJT1_BPBSP|nr:head maturation protease [Bacillus phage BSP38]AXH71113.1 putative prohead protease [Bacillus phage BSP38]AYJ75155.1 putative prohead protease [Bacillus phage BSP36]